jgi:hypothetical protein
MRFPIRARVILTSLILAAAPFLTVVASVLADGTPGPIPK